MSTIILESDAPTIIVDELDHDDEGSVRAAAPGLMPSFRPPALDPAVQSHSATSSRILARLLSMADSYRESGSLRQAIEIYFELVREHSETLEAHQAEDRLFDVAQAYERSGELRQARGLYEQLL